MFTPSFEQKVAQWYTLALTEKMARALIGHIRFTRAYGTMVSYIQLPEDAKVILRAAYREAQQETV